MIFFKVMVLTMALICNSVANADEVYSGEDADLNIQLSNESNRRDGGGYYGRRHGGYYGYGRCYGGCGRFGGNDEDRREIDLIPPQSPHITHIKPPWGGSITTSE